MDLIYLTSLRRKIESVWEAVAFVLVQYVCLDYFAMRVCVSVQLRVFFCAPYHAGQPLSEASVCLLQLQVGAVHNSLSRRLRRGEDEGREHAEFIDSDARL